MQLALIIRAHTEQLRASLAEAQRSVATAAEQMRRSLATVGEAASAAQTATSTGFRAVTDALRDVGGVLKEKKTALQQASFQLGDVLTQLSMGAPVMRTIAIQGAQMAQSFGAVGAILGVVGIAAASLWSAFADGANEAASLAGAADGVRSAIRDAADVMHGSVRSARELGQAYRELSEDARRLAELELTQGIARLNAEIAAVPTRVADAVAALRQLRETALGRVSDAEAAARAIVPPPNVNTPEPLRRALDEQRSRERAEIARQIAEGQRLLAAIDQAIGQLARGEGVGVVAEQMQRLSRTFEGESRAALEKAARDITELGLAGVEAERKLRELEARLRALRGEAVTDRELGGADKTLTRGAETIRERIAELALERQRLELQLSGASQRAAEVATAARQRELELLRAGIPLQSDLAREYLAQASAVDRLRAALVERAEAERRAREEALAARRAEAARQRQIAYAEDVFRALEQARRERREAFEADPSLGAGALRGLRDYAREAADVGRQVQDALAGAFRGAEEALTRFVATGRLQLEDLRDVARQILADVAAMVVRTTITGPLASAVGRGLADWLGIAIPAARGAVVDTGRVVPFAAGGVVSSPTLFPLRGGIGLMGEAGPEAILPLRRLASGRLGVEATGARPSVVVQQPVTITVDARGAGPTAGASVRQAAPRLARAVEALAAAQVRRQLARA